MTARADFKAWEALMSQSVIIWHNQDGESFRLAGCAECRGVAHLEVKSTDAWTVSKAWVRCPSCHGVTGNPIDVVDGLPQPVSGYPTDHPAGKCFPCSGVRGPKPQKVRATAGSGLRGR